jgi:DNA polymerase elongation subunit (family B)
LQLTFGEDGPNYLCFPDAPGVRWGEVEIYGRTNITIELGGRVALDYLQLFKKYTTVDRSSFKLESIADDYLPELPKIKYDGTLSDLYRNDYSKFTRYNIRDTEILKHLEDKLKYMSLANDIVHMTTAQFKHVTGTLKLAELAIVNFCHHELKQIVNDNDIDEDNTSTVQGAYVLEPKTGLHEWVVTLDINSLYPSVIMGINISPETIIGQMNLYEQSVDLIKNGDTTIAITLMYDDKSREHETYTGNQWNEILWERKWSISGYGTIFTQEQKGCIPMILDSWFSLRKKYQKQKEQAEIKMKEILSTAAKRQKSVDV